MIVFSNISFPNPFPTFSQIQLSQLLQNNIFARLYIRVERTFIKYNSKIGTNHCLCKNAFLFLREQKILHENYSFQSFSSVNMHGHLEIVEHLLSQQNIDIN